MLNYLLFCTWNILKKQYIEIYLYYNIYNKDKFQLTCLCLSLSAYCYIYEKILRSRIECVPYQKTRINYYFHAIADAMRPNAARMEFMLFLFLRLRASTLGTEIAPSLKWCWFRRIDAENRNKNKEEAASSFVSRSMFLFLLAVYYS